MDDLLKPEPSFFDRHPLLAWLLMSSVGTVVIGGAAALLADHRAGLAAGFLAAQIVYFLSDSIRVAGERVAAEVKTQAEIARRLSS